MQEILIYWLADFVYYNNELWVGIISEIKHMQDIEKILWSEEIYKIPVSKENISKSFKKYWADNEIQSNSYIYTIIEIVSKLYKVCNYTQTMGNDNRGLASADEKTRKRVASLGGKAPHDERGLEAADEETRKRVAREGGKASSGSGRDK